MIYCIYIKNDNHLDLVGSVMTSSFLLMDYIQALQDYDLTKNEAIIYVSLLQLGLSNVGPIAKHARLHRQMVYESLHALQAKGLVSQVLKNNRQHFQAKSPDTILKRLEEKESQAKALVDALFVLQVSQTDKIEVATVYGQRGFFDNLKDVVESAKRTDGIMRIIGGAKDTDFYHALGERYPDYMTILKKSQVRKFLISPEDSSDEFKKKFANEKGNMLKTMGTGLSSPTYTRITPEMVTIEIYSRASDMTIIQIRNSAIAQGYLEHFELLWGQARLFEV